MAENCKEITEAILEDLKFRHRSEIYATELAWSSGRRRCDFWALHPHPSKGHKAIAYEVKASRADFRKETHDKQREARLFSDEFWYIAPSGVIPKDEVPDWAGLIDWSPSKFKVSVAAPTRSKDAPSWELIVSIIRNSGDVRRDTELMRQQVTMLKAENERLLGQVYQKVMGGA